MKNWDTLYCNGSIVSVEENGSPYGLIEEGAVGVQDGQIVWVGKEKDLPGSIEHMAKKVMDLKRGCLAPGLIDCHTHAVYAGNRALEFEMRLNGASYEEIARAGGGIRSTVTQTRAASEDELFAQSLSRVKKMVESGVTTLEIKSGYGLNLETELKLLRVAKRIGVTLKIQVLTTFLGAHALPQEFEGRSDAYIDYVCEEMLPRIAQEKLADFIDVFCENIGFTLAQTERVFLAAKKYNLKIKCHAEQLSDLGASKLAAEYGALSVDHLEFISEKSIAAIAASGTVAVLLPGAFYFLREQQLPPIELLRQYHVPIAIATDCNPGTSPFTSLLLMLNMACTLFRLTPEEAFLGVTRNAAKALGLEKERGTIAMGKKAVFSQWDVAHPRELAYAF